MRDPYERWLGEIWLHFSMNRGKPHIIISGVTGDGDVSEIMEELRQEDPEAAMLLGEWIVVEEEE